VSEGAAGGSRRSGSHQTLALERTALAWSRSGLAVVGCLAALARRFVPLETSADRVAALVLLAFAGLSWAIALFLSRRRAGALDPRAGSQQGHLFLVAFSTVAVGLGALLIGLFPPD